MWVTKLLISQVKKGFFAPKTTKFVPKLSFLVELGQTMQAFSVPCWWVSCWLWRAGCISQDTYLLYNIAFFCLTYSIFLPFQIPSFCSLQGLLGRVEEKECENVCPSQTLLGQTEHNECKGTNQGWPCYQLLCIGDSGFWRQNKQMCTKPNQYQQSVICLVAFVISLDKTPSFKPHKC